MTDLRPAPRPRRRGYRDRCASDLVVFGLHDAAALFERGLVLEVLLDATKQRRPAITQAELARITAWLEDVGHTLASLRDVARGQRALQIDDLAERPRVAPPRRRKGGR